MNTDASDPKWVKNCVLVHKSLLYTKPSAKTLAEAGYGEKKTWPRGPRGPFSRGRRPDRMAGATSSIALLENPQIRIIWNIADHCNQHGRIIKSCYEIIA